MTSATGGSASSQADSLDRRAWQPRPWVSVSIRIATLVVPILAAVVAVKVTASWISRPGSPLLFWLWMAALIAVSVAASIGTQRLTRRFAPLGALFKMSLVFPDEAPSRIRTAMRAGSTPALARRFESSATASSPEQAAAEKLVALMAGLNRHDRLTRGHSERVRAYSVMLGEEIGLSRDDLDKLNWAALVHDIGKLEVPESILNKPGRPNDHEWAVLRTHPKAAGVYVEPLRPWLGDWVDAATQHHERYDGGGYPNGKAGAEISLSGRVVAIGDAYDVMTAIRSYKKPLPAAQARAELLRNAGTQFDPGLIRSFLQISLGRLRWVIGPLGWLSHFPDIMRIPLTTVATTSGGLVTAGAVMVAAATGVLTPTVISPEPAVAVAVERTISDTPDDHTIEATEPLAAQQPSPIAFDDPDDDDNSSETAPEPGDPTPTTTGPANTTTPTQPSTTIPGSPTTTVAPPATTTTTTAATTTTTSTTTTTTAPPPLLDQEWFTGSGGYTKSQSYLPLDGTLAGGPLPNFDTDRDSQQGLLILKGDGLSETDETKMQRWWYQLGGATQILSTPTLDVWVAVIDFATDKTGHVVAGIYECADDKTDCNLLTSGTASFDQAAFGADFGKLVITMPAINVTLPANRGLILKVAVPQASDDDLWFAYGTTTYPIQLSINS